MSTSQLCLSVADSYHCTLFYLCASLFLFLFFSSLISLDNGKPTGFYVGLLEQLIHLWQEKDQRAPTSECPYIVAIGKVPYDNGKKAQIQPDSHSYPDSAFTGRETLATHFNFSKPQVPPVLCWGNNACLRML